MKTPREILTERHRSAELKLDAIRKDVLAGHTGANLWAKDRTTPAKLESLPSFPILPVHQDAKEETVVAATPAEKPAFSFSLFAQNVWQELVLPCRQVWIGMAAVWLVIFAVNVLMNLPAGGAVQLASSNAFPPNPETVRVLKEQKLMLAQLLGPSAPPAVKPGTSGPRSERRRELFIS